MGNLREALGRTFLASQLFLASCGPLIPPPPNERYSPTNKTNPSYSEPIIESGDIASEVRELIDLSQIPQGRENEVQKDLTKLQEILRFYINTSEHLLGKDLADHYKKTIDSVDSASDGTLYKNTNNQTFGFPGRNGVSFTLLYPFIHESRTTISGQNGKTLTDTLQLFLDSNGKLQNTSSNTEIMPIDDVEKRLKIFKVPLGWVKEENRTDDYSQTGRNYMQHTIELTYPDGSYILMLGTTKGDFFFHVQAGTTNAYIAP